MTRLLKRALVALGFVVAAASCANNGLTPNDGGTDASVIGPCGPGVNAICGGTCVDTNSDFQNCGVCGKVCPSDQVCSHGQCATVCGGGSVRCGNDCVDTSSDVKNCGGCGAPCAGGQVCNKGTCAATCQAGLTNCNGDCVDITQNDDNCSACGSACPGGQVCSNSQCIATCQSGWTSCAVGDAGATTCVDTQHDPQNCGACGTPCTQGYFCSPMNNVGTCGLLCAGGTSLCGSACVDESIDPNHCGACTTVCNGNTPVCTGAHCCGVGQAYCGGCDSVTNCIKKSGGAIAAGFGHTCAISVLTGKLKCWGFGDDGELGDGNGTSSSSPVVAGLSGTPIFVGSGSAHTCAIVQGGAAYCWGYDYDGEMGNGTTQTFQVVSPVQVSNITNATRIDGGGDHACAIDGGALKCWGGNFYGDLGNNDPFTEQDSPISTGLSSVIDVNLGIGYSSCAVLSGGTVDCWGDDQYGQCGDPNLAEDDTPFTVSLAKAATAIALGSEHACAIVTGGDVYCWGDDSYGELGDGNTATQTSTPVQANVSNVIALAAGGDGFDWDHTCALLSSGAVKCWGSNDYGQLGDGTNTSNPSPVTPIASNAVAIAAGERHTCVLKGDGTVWCWGYNGDGELGDGTNTDSNVPVQVQGF